MKCPVCNEQNHKHRYVFTWGKIFECPSCKCAYSDASDTDEMNRVMFDKMDGGVGIELHRKWAEDRLGTLQKYINSGKLLEFGYGSGEFLYTAAKSGFYSVGVDTLSALRQENNHSSVSLVKCDARAFRSRIHFDAVVALHMLEHFSQPYEFLTSVRENLKDKGYFLVEVPNYMSLIRIVTGAQWRCFVEYHALHLTTKCLIALLERAGFKILTLETVGCSTSQVIGLGIPFLLRRIGLRSSSTWIPGDMFQRFANMLERPFLAGVNIRTVAQKV